MSITLDASRGEGAGSSRHVRPAEERECAAGLDAAAFAALYEQYRDDLYRFCRRRAHDPTLLDDIVQDVFERAFARRSQFDPTRRFWPWVSSIAARTCIDAHRRSVASEARHDHYAKDTRQEPFDVTAATVLGVLERNRLGRHLAALPARQRAALALFALDGWTYEDIARQLGTSANVVKALIQRARATLRETAGRWIGGSIGLARALGTRLHQLLARAQAAFGSSFDFLGPAGATLSSPPAVGLVIVVLAALVAPDATRPVPSVVPDMVSSAAAAPHRAAEASTMPTTATVPRPSKPPSGSAPLTAGAEQAGHAAVATVLPERAVADTGTVKAVSFTQSTEPDDDPVLFVAGEPMSERAELESFHRPGLSVPLLVSRDDGTSWQRRRALGLAPVRRLLLPPTYPADHRLFAVTMHGLQVSHDDGDTFATLLALPEIGDVAFSPGFGSGDRTMLLVAGDRLWRYAEGDGGATAVAVLGPPATHLVANVRFDAEPTDGRTIVLGTRLPTIADSGHYVSRCATTPTASDRRDLAVECTSVKLPHSNARELPLRAAGHFRSGLLYIPFRWDPLVSLDGGRTFRPARTGRGSDGGWWEIFDLAADPSTAGERAVVAQRTWTHTTRDGLPVFGPQLARTDDAGLTWHTMTVDLPHFDFAQTVVVTPTGRIIAASGTAGLACSHDGGRTWARTCPAAPAR